MIPERIIAVMAAVIAFGVFSAVPGSLSDFWKTSSAPEWESTYGRVTARTNITLPSMRCFVHSARYSLISYTYEGPNGQVLVGSAQAPQLSEIYPGSSIKVLFDPATPAESYPAVSVDAYRTASIGMLIFALPLGFGMLYVTRRLWREGNKTAPTWKSVEGSRLD
jgi:hypothetical protein